MDADIFVSGKKKLRIKKYPDTCGRGLKRKRSVLSVKDKNEDADDIVFQMICKSIVYNKMSLS